jgi:Flp pilus assembly protein TadD
MATGTTALKLLQHRDSPKRLPYSAYQCRLLCFVLMVWIAGAQAYCIQQPERTHAQRFAPQDERLRSAEQEASARLRENPSDVKMLLDLGLARLRLGKVDAAIADFRRAAVQKPALAEVQSDLAYALWMRGDLRDALHTARAALLLDPSDASAHRYAGRLLLLQGGDRSEAIGHLERAVQLNPEETDAHLDLVMAYRSAGDPPNAWAQLRLLQTEFAENDPRLLYVQGLLFSDQGRSALAIDFFRRACAGNPNLGEARDALGIELAQAGRWAEALDVLGPAAKANSRSFRVTYAYALALMNTQHLAEAEEVAGRATDLNPGSAEARALLGQIKARLAPPGEKRP